jgi:hypothetical protein
MVQIRAADSLVSSTFAAEQWLVGGCTRLAGDLFGCESSFQVACLTPVAHQCRLTDVEGQEEVPLEGRKTHQHLGSPGGT